MVRRAGALTMLPMLMPALVAGVMGGVGGDEVSGVGGEDDVDGDKEEGEEGYGEDEDVSAVVAVVEEIDNAVAVILEPPPSEAKSLRPMSAAALHRSM